MTEGGAPEEREVLAHADAAVIATDLDGRITLWNRGAEAAFGYRGADALGRDFRELAANGAEDAAATALALAAAGASWSGELRVTRADGSEAVLATTVSPVRNPAGEVVGTIGVANDLTTIRAGEEVIRRRQELYRLVLENVHDLIALLDGEGRILYASPSHLSLLGWSPEELVGVEAVSRFHPDDAERVAASLRRAAESGSAVLEPVRFGRRDGGWVPLEARLTGVRDDDAGETLVLAVSRDLSEAKEAESAARESRGLFETVLASVGDAIVVLDTDGRFVFANDGARRLVGLDERSLPATSADVLAAFELTAEDGTPLPPERLPSRRVLAGEPAAEEVVAWRAPETGEQRVSAVQALPVRGDDDALRYVIVVFHDVTEQRRAERRLRFLAEAGRLLATLDVEAALRELAPLVVPAFAAAVAVDLEGAGRVVEPGTAPQGEPLALPLASRGRPLGTLSLWAPADPELAAELAGRVAAAAENARLHEETRQAAALLDTLFATAPVGLAFLDHEQRFVRVNAALAAINGLPAEQHVGMRPQELFPAIDPEVGARFRRVLEERRPLLDQEESGETPAQPGVVRHFRVSYYPIDGAEGEPVGAGVVVIETTGQKRVEAEREAAREDAERAATTLLRLGRLTEAALQHLSMHDLLHALLVRLVEVLDADAAALLLLDEAGTGLEVRATVGLEAELEHALTIPLGEGLAGRVAAEGTARVIDELDDADVVSPHLRERGIHSLVAAPLFAEGRVVGVYHVDSVQPRRFGPEDARLLELASDRVVLAIEQSRLYDAERLAQERLRFLAEASGVLGASLDYERTLSSLAALVVPRFADLCAIHLVRDDGSIGIVSIASRDPAGAAAAFESARESPIDARSTTGVAGVVNLGRAALVPEVSEEFVAELAADRPGREESLRALVGSSALAAPLAARGRVVGALTFVREPGSPRYHDADLAFAEELAARAATAVDNARLYREAEEQAQSARILQSVGDGVFLVDREGVVRYWNRAAESITGLRAEAVVDRRLTEVVGSWAAIERLVPVGAPPASMPLQVRERELWVSISGVALDEGTVYAFRDLTEERAIEELRAEFVSTVSHELRTPLAAIYGAAMTLRRGDVRLDEEQRARLLGVVAGEADRLARTVNDILWASRLDAGALSVAIQSCDAAELAGLVVEAQRAHLPPGIELRLTVEERLPPVAADPDKVRQVLVNLVDNAVKYSPDGGLVELRVAARGAHVRFAVSDEGLGIPYAEQRRIFDKFYRLDPNLTRGVGGTGLGLYICRELVRRMDGRIWVDSSPRGGSTFTVELPLAGGDGDVTAHVSRDL